MSDTPEFVNGLIFKLPREGAPEFVKGSLSIRREELMTFLIGKEGQEWINVDLKVSKVGKAYAQVNDWKPENNQERRPSAQTQASPQNNQQSAPQSQAPAPIDNEFDDKIPW